MRFAARPALLTLGAVAASLLLGSGQATAGGPTSVLIANPATGEAAALYATDARYDELQSVLEPAAGGDAAPDDLRAGPGTPAINVTWLTHDVGVWRVDRVRLDVDGGPWVLTNQAGDGDQDWLSSNGSWHQAADPDGVHNVLSSLGVLDEDSSSSTDPAKPAPTTSDEATPVASGVQADMDSSSGSAWWLPIAAGGVLLGALGRPYAGSWFRRWRVSAPRQQLIDM